MKLPLALSRSVAAAVLVLGACTSSAPTSARADSDAQMPEPVRPAASTTQRTAPTGLALAVSGGGTELYVIDPAALRIISPHGTRGGADADPAEAVQQVTRALAGLRFWAEDGALLLDGPAPLAGRARTQTRGGVLRVSLSSRGAAGSPQGSLTAEVRGDEIVGRLAQRSPAGDARAWTHGAFFRAPLRRVEPRDWPPRAPRTLSAERVADGGVLLRWTPARNAPADAEYLVYRTGDASRAAVQVGATRKTHFVADAEGRAAGPAWYVVTRSARGEQSGPSPFATVP